MGLHTTQEMEIVGFGVYWADSARQVPDKGNLNDYWKAISSKGDFLGSPHSYTSIREPILRRKSGVLISGGQFVARLAAYFGLLTKQLLQGLTVITPELPLIDMAELVRLQICEEIEDTWAWVAPGPERQPKAAASAPKDGEVAPDADIGAQPDPAPVQAPQAPPAHAQPRSMTQRIARMEEDVREIRGQMTQQGEVLDAMARDFSRFTVWAAGGITELLRASGVTFASYSMAPVPYQRRVRRRTGEASTSGGARDED
ncbi:hypothetical protein Tco_1284169 [Tanacetum coccineum]